MVLQYPSYYERCWSTINTPRHAYEAHRRVEGCLWFSSTSHKGMSRGVHGTTAPLIKACPGVFMVPLHLSRRVQGFSWYSNTPHRRVQGCSWYSSTPHRRVKGCSWSSTPHRRVQECSWYSSNPHKGVCRGVHGTPAPLIGVSRGVYGTPVPLIGVSRGVHGTPAPLIGVSRGVHGTPPPLIGVSRGVYGTPVPLIGVSRGVHGTPAPLIGVSKGVYGTPAPLLDVSRVIKVIHAKGSPVRLLIPQSTDFPSHFQPGSHMIISNLLPRNHIILCSFTTFSHSNFFLGFLSTHLIVSLDTPGFLFIKLTCYNSAGRMDTLTLSARGPSLDVRI